MASGWLRRARRWVMARMPFPILASDVSDVIYLNWVVAADRAAELVPPGVDLVEREGRVIFTVLTYRHRNFGPAMLGPLRRLFPSPLQSNWRFYVDRISGGTATATVLFVANVFDSTLYTIATRLFSDALPSDLALRFEHRRDKGRYLTAIAGGGGSSPDLSAVTRAGESVLPADFASFFADWEEAVRHLSLQDVAICSVDDLPGRLALAEIDLPIDLARIEPLVCAEWSGGPWLDRLGVHAPPFAFRVPGVAFRVVSERLIATG